MPKSSMYIPLVHIGAELARGTYKYRFFVDSVIILVIVLCSNCFRIVFNGY